MPLELAIGTQLGRSQATGITYHVDSVAGDDGNDGLSPSAPFETLGAIPTLSPGTTIKLKKGSHWREALVIDENAVSIQAYGTGAAPIIDASDILANASFSKTAGRTNVYEISVTPEWTANDYLNVWEDNAFLVRAADVADCDASPGSYYPSAAAGTITLYVHASDSSSLIANGKTYETAIRAYAITFGSQSGCSIDGLALRRCLSANGVLSLGPNNRASSLTVKDGTSHLVYIRTGCALTNVSATDLYFGAEPVSVFVVNENTPDGEGVTFTNCTADGGNQNTKATGFYSHKNTSGDFGTITAEGCAVVDCLIGFEFLDTAATVLTGCRYTGWNDSACKGIRISTGTAPLTIDDFTATMSAGRWLTSGQAIEITVTDSEITFTALALTGIIYLTGAADLTITGTTITDPDLSNAIYLTSGSASLYARQNTYSDPMRVLYLHTDTSYDSDYNSFSEENMRHNVEGAGYLTISDYVTATGQDQNSTVGS